MEFFKLIYQAKFFIKNIKNMNITKLIQNNVFNFCFINLLPESVYQQFN